MSERYSRLSLLPEQLYTKGAPVIIAAGTLLKDSTTNRVLVQLKLHSISTKKIKAVTVEITPKDTADNPLGTPIEHQYLDLSAGRNQDFAQKEPIILPDNKARGFSAAVTNVIFEDNSVWETSGGEWAPLPTPTPLEAKFQNSELAKEYRLQMGGRCEYSPEEYEDLWRCTCGTLNHFDVESCPLCRKQRADLFAMDLGVLTAQMEKRLAAEAEAAEAARIAAEEEARLQKIRHAKIVKLSVAGAIVCLLLIAAFVWVATAHLRVKKDAKVYADAGDYMTAVATLDAFRNPEKVSGDRQLYVDLMEAEIQKTIKEKDYAAAKHLIETYSVLDTAAENIKKVQSMCPHKEQMEEHLDRTCTEDGYDRKTCNTCGRVKVDKFKALGHKTTSEVLSEPTCTENGIRLITCSICEHKETEPIAASHNYIINTIKTVTCTTKGQTQEICLGCGDKKELVDIPAKGHSWKSATCNAPKTCTGCGITEGSKLGHVWKNQKATGLSCERCSSAYPVNISISTDFPFALNLPNALNDEKIVYQTATPIVVNPSDVELYADGTIRVRSLKMNLHGYIPESYSTSETMSLSWRLCDSQNNVIASSFVFVRPQKGNIVTPIEIDSFATGAYRYISPEGKYTLKLLRIE